MKTTRAVLASALAMLCATAAARAAAPEAEAAKLGSELTPMGAIAAGNAAGTIPPWEGGIAAPPPGYERGMHHPDPFAGDAPLFTITAANAAEHRAHLSPGQLAVLERYPDTFRMPVYPTRRSAAYPQRIYDATVANARTAQLTADGNGVVSAAEGIPFPIPGNGLEAIWNHMMRYRGETLHRVSAQVVPTVGGNYTPVRIVEDVVWAYARPGGTTENIDNKFIYFLQEITSPPRLAGGLLLVHETLNQAAEPRRAWVYNPGRRRVRRAPNVAYDNPGSSADSQRTNDQYDMYNGSPDRYEWTLVGRQELYIPYNSYRLHSDSVSFDDILQPGHINPDLTRYELHRVWVVEAALREGTSHIYPRRTFYIDEDSWQAAVIDHYDGQGEIWRVGEAHVINYYEVPLILDTVLTIYDVQNGRYLVSGLNNEYEMIRFDEPMDLDRFTPEALRRLGRR